MKRNRKSRIEERVKKARRCLQGEISIKEAAREAGVGKTTAARWTRQYEAEGIGAFQPGRNQYYPVEMKLRAVEDCISGKGSRASICKKYEIKDERQLRSWIKVHKVYLSAILDLYDRRIVAYVIDDRNDNPLVYKTFEKAVKANPDAHPLFHSDRGFQYTNRTFHHKLVKAGMAQSMSRVAHCIDNGPMEGFWGILKRERCYGKRFTSKQELIYMIVSFIRYCNTRRVQRNLGVLTPMERHVLGLAA